MFDGNVSFAGGQNGGVLADRIAADQYASGVNVTTMNGAISPRPRFIHIPLKFLSRSEHEKYWPSLRGGKFQCACFYRSDAGSHIITVINGRIFAVDPISGVVQHIGLPQISLPDRRKMDDKLHPRAKRINFAKAGRFLVLFDYPQRPVIMDGLIARRASSQEIIRTVGGVPTVMQVPEVPESRAGCFVQNRLFVANDAHEFGAGDPVGGINADAPVTFEESLSPAGAYNGQFFSLGTTNINNPITYMGYLQMADTSTGYGPLVVATDEALYTFAANRPRAEWEFIEQFGALSLYSAGVVGQRAAVNVNSDLLFMSGDGQIRSLHMGRDEQTRWSAAPISREVANWMKCHDHSLLKFSVAASHKNRVFFTVNPFTETSRMEDGTMINDIAFHGMVVLELDNVSGLGQQARPAWAGMWQGIKPMEICQGFYDGMNLLHIWSKDPGGINNLYLMSDNPDADADVFEGVRKPVVSRLYSRLYDFNARFVTKALSGLDIKMSNITGRFSVLAEHRSSSNEPFAKWAELNAGVDINCETPPDQKNCIPPFDTAPVTLKELHFGTPEAAQCNPLTNESGDSARVAQIRLTISGPTWSLEDIRLSADESDNRGRKSVEFCNSPEKVVLKKSSPPCPDAGAGKFASNDDWSIHSVAERLAVTQPCQPCTETCPPPQPETLCEPCQTT